MPVPVNMLDEVSNFIFTSKYARYNEKLHRRETWNESVDRSLQMHLKKYSFLSKEDKDEIRWAFSLVEDKRVAGSMRSLQFAGKAIESKNEKIYNCSVRHIDSIRAFAEVFFLSLNGCGTTFGLTRHFFDRMPDLVNAEDKTGTVVTYTILDTIEGWSDSIEALLNCYFRNTAYTGRKIVFDYSRIRKKGTILKTTGGKAPGYKGLKACHTKVKQILDTIIEEYGQTRLKTINAYDILCHEMDAVLSGGIRRSAAAVIFDCNDEDMMKAKIGNWRKENPQRARTNNSALILRNKTTYEEFKKLIKFTKEFGEPGFVFANDLFQLCNPCFEINFIPVTKDGVCGVQFCNLSTINGVKVKTKEQFKECVKAATIIGTLQAGYTHFPYLSQTAKQLTEEEALLGVSITGMMDSPEILLDEDIQKDMATYAVKINKTWAKKIGINQAARVTCIKPEGTSSLIFGSGSGIHPHHARKYFRRVQNNKIDNVYKFFKKHNPHMCDESVWSANKTDDVISFPLDINEKAMVKEDLTAIRHLEIIKATQKNWVNTGTTEVNTKPITHNVSCTVIVKKDEWDKVTEYLFSNKEYFAAVSLSPDSSDKDFEQAPNEEVKTKEDIEKFTAYLKGYVPIDYTKLKEENDETHLQQETACAGGACSIV